MAGMRPAWAGFAAQCQRELCRTGTGNKTTITTHERVCVFLPVWSKATLWGRPCARERILGGKGKYLLGGHGLAAEEIAEHVEASEGAGGEAEVRCSPARHAAPLQGSGAGDRMVHQSQGGRCDGDGLSRGMVPGVRKPRRRSGECDVVGNGSSAKQKAKPRLEFFALSSLFRRIAQQHGGRAV